MRLVPFLQSLATDRSPRVHANGFIQIDISPAVRLHVWGDPRIPRQQNRTPIHDHAFSFTSRVLIGTLNQRTFHVDPRQPEADFAPEQQLYIPHVARVEHGENTVLESYASAVAVVVEESRYISAADDGEGAVYSMKRGEFHESVPLGPAVSVIVKSGPSLTQGGGKPTVLVPVGVNSSNDFDRHAALAAGDIWEIVRDVVRMDPEAVATGIAWAVLA
jgi:hypothetical protein